jgi:hypothetical protein
MEQDTILLNGGHDHEVDCLDGVNLSLMRLLGRASLRPAVAFLRAAQDAEGQHSVAVFIGASMSDTCPDP